MTSQTSWEDFTAALAKDPRAAAISPMNVKLALTALQARADQRDRDQRRSDVRSPIDVQLEWMWW